MAFTHMLISADQASLENGEKAFGGVAMNGAVFAGTGIGFVMVNSLMLACQHGAAIDRRAVCVEGGGRVNMVTDGLPDFMQPTVANDLGFYPPVTLDQRDKPLVFGAGFAAFDAG